MVLTAGLALGPQAGGEQSAAPAPGGAAISVDEVVPGQRGTGYSVFSGTTPEPFEAEVLGVWRNVQPGTSYILAKLEGQGLERTGVIAGMSGSPVYFDGRLAGAVAFSWAFSSGAVAGITPIESMRRLAGGSPAAPRSIPARAAASPSEMLRRLLSEDLDESSLLAPLAGLGSGGIDGARSGVQWVASGIPERVRAYAALSLGPVAPAGVMTAAPAPSLRPGSAVAGVLMDGDLRLAATGTVTDVLGEEIVAFGHPFLGLGSAVFPMAAAEVVTVVASQINSFKISNIGPVLGAFTRDHQVGLAGRLGLEAPMVPVDLEIEGSGASRFAVRVADVPQVSPNLMALALWSAVLADPAAAGSQAIDLRFAIDLGPRGELQMSQTFDGSTAPAQAAVYLLAVANYLVQNPFEEARIAGVRASVRAFPEPRAARLVAAHASRTRVRPGDRVSLYLDLAAYRGDSFRRTLEITLPTDLPEGRYSLLVGDGFSIDAARLAVERADPTTFRQALELLRSLHSRRSIVVLGVFADPGLSVAGEILPQLPASIRSLWVGAATGSAVPLQLAVAQQDRLDLDVPVDGIVRLDLEVERREPLPAGWAGEVEATDAGGERAAVQNADGEPE
jgi:hypothetical protein